MSFPVGNRLIAALDVPNLKDAVAFVKALEGVVSWVKVGLELFCAEGPHVLSTLLNANRASIRLVQELQIMLDLKLHDIPETVARATARVAKLGVRLLTVHASGGRSMMEAAVKAAQDNAGLIGDTKILAVTVLTSLTNDDMLWTNGAAVPVEDVVKRRAELAVIAGCAGVVASPHEVKAIREIVPRDFLIVTPGIRPAGTDHGDQKRVMTPREARAAGADLIVVGRPLRDAANRAAAARDIVSELS